jgi:hypothetical protein
MQYDVKTTLTAPQLTKLDRACEKQNLSRYAFLRKAVMEKIERDRKSS